MAKKIKSKMSKLLEIPKEVVLDLPLISVVGNEEVTIENYKGIVEYSDERIRLKSSSGIIKIEGRNLSLKQITNESVMVTGVIQLLGYVN